MSKFLIFCMFLTGLISFLLEKKNFLSSLIKLEMMICSMFLYYFSFSGNGAESLYFLPSFLTLVVCESALGISVLVTFSREKGSSFMNFSHIMMW